MQQTSPHDFQVVRVKKGAVLKGLQFENSLIVIESDYFWNRSTKTIEEATRDILKMTCEYIKDCVFINCNFVDSRLFDKLGGDVPDYSENGRHIITSAGVEDQPSKSNAPEWAKYLLFDTYKEVWSWHENAPIRDWMSIARGMGSVAWSIDQIKYPAFPKAHHIAR